MFEMYCPVQLCSFRVPDMVGLMALQKWNLFSITSRVIVLAVVSVFVVQTFARYPSPG